MGRILILFGIIIIVLGLLLELSGRMPFIGKLPGDIYIRRGNFSFYFPVTSVIIGSILMSIIINIVSRLLK